MSVEPVVLLLGNPRPHHTYTVPVLKENGEVELTRQARPHEILKQSVTRVVLRPGYKDRDHVDLAFSSPISTEHDRALEAVRAQLPDKNHYEHIIAVHEVNDLMAVHSGGASPTWVSCPADPIFEQALATFYKCPIGEPTMLLTNQGRDDFHAQTMTTSSQPAPYNYIGLTASTTAPAATDTTLTGEITTAGGGLIRAQVTYAHTAGTNVTTLTKTFTANGSDSLPVTIAQDGVFNASTSGHIAFHTALSGTATLSVSGDNITVTHTVDLG